MTFLLPWLRRVLESFALEWARAVITPSSAQYGGETGYGPAHFLIEIYDFFASYLQDNRAAVTVSSLDYSKAFNRLTGNASRLCSRRSIDGDYCLGQRVLVRQEKVEYVCMYVCMYR